MQATAPKTREGTLVMLERQLSALSGPQAGKGEYYEGRRTALRGAIDDLRLHGPVRALGRARKVEATAGYWARLDLRDDFNRGQAAQAQEIVQELEELLDSMR